MPELAEVVYYARQWDAGLGRRIARVHVHPRARVFRGGHADQIAAALTGATYEEALTHGKNMLFRFSGGAWLGGHLGMTGEMLAEAPDYTPQKHDHLVLYTSGVSLVYRDPRMFGLWRLDKGSAPPAWWQSLPPEVLSPQFTAAFVGDFLRRHVRSPLKALLLDQSAFAGIGNWMADEALWQLRLHPATPAGRVDAAALRKTLQHITRTAVRTIGRDWSDPPASWLFRHRWKAGGNCPRCGQPLTRGPLRGRTACWCPHCQPEA